DRFTWNALGDANAGVIDHVIYKSAEHPLHATDGGILVWDKPLSDHHPIWVELTVPEPSSSAVIGIGAATALLVRPARLPREHAATRPRSLRIHRQRNV